MKLCKDCKHIKLQDKIDMSRCTHPATVTTRVSPINGENVVTYKTAENGAPGDFLPFCDHMRAGYGLCGEEARLFEEKTVEVEV